MMHIDDDKDYIIDPREQFLGYKCPHSYCDIIQEDHDFCRAVRQRIDAIAEKKYDDPDWFETFKWNYQSWLIKIYASTNVTIDGNFQGLV